MGQPCRHVPATPAVAFLGKTTVGVTTWAVLPGRAPGQHDHLRHLTWGGPGDTVHLHEDGRTGSAGDRQEYPGRQAAAVSGPCTNPAEAAAAAQAWAAAQPEPVHPFLAAAATPGLTYAQAEQALKGLYQIDPAGPAWAETSDIEDTLYWAGRIGAGYLGGHVVIYEGGAFRIILNPKRSTP
jgi:hypothetical protein